MIEFIWPLNGMNVIFIVISRILREREKNTNNNKGKRNISLSLKFLIVMLVYLLSKGFQF